MGLMNTALNIGRSALLSYSSALQVVGNNISNAGSPDYTRQTVGLSPIGGPPLPEGMRPGAGVALTSLRRNLNESLENRLRSAIGQNESLATQQVALAQVEALFDPSTGLQLADRITEFFNSMDRVQNDPFDAATRELALSAASNVAGSLRQTRSSLAELASQFDDQINAVVTQDNELAASIAELNGEIVNTEAGGSPASALRDQRDGLLRRLSEDVNLSVRVQPNGSVIVYVGNEALIQGSVSRGLKTVSALDGEFKRTRIAFADNNSGVAIQGGRLEGLILARDHYAVGRIAEIDQLAAAVIYEVNKVHSDGQGLIGFTTLTSAHRVARTDAVLSSTDAGLPFAVQNGSFYLAVRDQSTGALRSYQVPVDLDGTGDNDATLESLIETINDTVTGVTASVTVDQRLNLTADSGLEFVFGYDGQTQRLDSSHALAALGMNAFFDGSSAADIALNPLLENQPAFLAAAAVNLTGDGTNAGRLASLAGSAADALGGVSLLDFYGSIAASVAVDSHGARQGAETATSVLSSLQAQKENISGVSLDEEAVELLKYERAFEGAARYVSVVERLSQELIALLN